MENPENWNAEQKRLERKRRLEKLKSKQGEKMPIQKSGKFSRIFFPVLAVVLVLTIGVWAAIQFAVPQKLFPAMSIDGKNVSSVEFSFYYVNTLSQLELDTTTKEGKAKLETLCAVVGHEEETWNEYAYSLTAKTILEFQIQYDLALAENMALSDEEKEEIQGIFDNLITQTGSAVEADKYLVDNFGKNVTIKTLIPIFEKSTLANKYAMDQIEKIEIDEAQIQSYYNENKNDYEKVTFRMVAFLADTTTESTTEEVVAAQAVSLGLAEDFLEKITDEASFKRLADEKIAVDIKAEEDAAYAAMSDEDKIAYDEAEQTKEENLAAVIAGMTTDEKAAYENGKASMDQTLVRSMGKSDVAGANPDLADWLFSADRLSGDMDIFTLSDNNYVFMFVSKENSMDLVTARHILISPNPDKDLQNGDVFTAEEWAEARTQANDVFGQISSLDRFVELVTEYTTDPGSKDTGGLYEDIKKGDMMPQFDEWIFDDSRKADDMGIVRTDYGYHIMRFESRKSTTTYDENKDLIKNILAEKKYVDQLDASKELDQYQYKIHPFGLKLIDV